MKFYYTDALDMVDPNFNFSTDTSEKKRSPYWDDVFAHQIFPEAPYDGLLISRATLGRPSAGGKFSMGQAQRFMRTGARNFYRLEVDKFKDLKIMGDNGAFAYHKEETPPYSIEEMVEFYDSAGVDKGCSLDHIVYEFDDHDSASDLAKFRYDLTLDLAEKFLHECKGQKVDFEPIGVVQGWSTQSMNEAAGKLLDMGFKLLSIGGLVPLKIEQIIQAIASVDEAVKKKSGARIHLLGFAKIEHLHLLSKFRIESFDSSSPLIRAFKDVRRNYWLPNQNNGLNQYSAIRIPQSDGNPTLLKAIKRGEVRQEELRKQEKTALEAFRSIEQSSIIGLEDKIDAIMDYAKILIKAGNTSLSEAGLEKEVVKQKNWIRKTLEDRVWEKCACPICQDIGIEVVLFRAANRNRRRGMHNLFVFKNQLSSLLKQGKT